MSLEIAFLEELTGFFVLENFGGIFYVYENNKIPDSTFTMPFATIKFCEDDVMSVKFGGKNFFFELNDKNWIDCFEEIWQLEVERIERRTKRIYGRNRPKN